MRIVDPGPSPEVEKEVICRNCGATLAYVPADVKKYSGTDYSGGPDGRHWVDCPQCGSEVTIKRW